MPFDLSGVLLLKLGLVPILLGAATLAQWKWGDSVGGWLAGFPFVAGPILLVLALQDGPAFAAHAATGALLGVVLLSLFTLIQAWISPHFPWYITLPIGWGVYVLLGSGLTNVELDWAWAALLALVSLWGSRWLLPRQILSQNRPAPKGIGELVLRMAAAETLVLAITGLSRVLGSGFTGILTPFPVATSVLLGFAHARLGASSVTQTLRGFLPSLSSLVVFFVVLHHALPRYSIAISFGGAWGTAGLVQLGILAYLRRFS